MRTPEEMQKHREYMREWTQKNRDRLSEERRAKRASPEGDKIRARQRERYHKRRDVILPKNRQRWKERSDEIKIKVRKSKYGVTAEQYDQMMLAQNECCDLCGKKRRLCIDHNHQTKAVRALLCHPCNTAIGLLKEDPELMWRAIEYVVAHKPAAEGAIA